MCGIFGLLKTDGSKVNDQDIAISKEASFMMQRRGPDDEGFWSNDLMVFSFRRLSIIDLSPAGHQPMHSLNGGHTIVFNGELYNYKDLRDQLVLKGYQFQSQSDTEVVLYSLIEWGEEALSKFNGMFALAFWDSMSKSILIARDHVGMKPLYYAIQENKFLFGSQLDQIILGFDKRNLSMDKVGLSFFLSVGYYPSPRTVFREIKQLEPGQWFKIYADNKIERGIHFDLLSFYQNHSETIATQSVLEESLSRAVKRHLMSDVPFATFLSGGLDSGIITALTKQNFGSNFTAYTLSNESAKFDESKRAKLVASELGIKHKIVAPVNMLSAIKVFQDAYQEPFGDYSAIPSLLVTAEAKKEVKVMLSGDGSDEFFFGYNRMTSMLQSAKYYQLPFLLRRIYKRVNPKIPAITFSTREMMVLKKQSWGYNATLFNLGVTDEELAHEFIAPFGNRGLDGDVMIKLNTIHRYFQLQLLKLDRASMYNSIEARVPFADKDFLQHSIAYTSKEATRKNYTVRKVPLQGIYNRLYPNIPVDVGTKKGFTIDMNTILSTDLKDLFLDSLTDKSYFSDVIDFKFFREEFLTEKKINPFFNWFLLSLQAWSGKYWNN